jgi:hypothetical protein
VIDPISLGIAAILLGIGLTVIFWHHIVDLFSTHLIPFMRQKIGSGVADAVASVIGWLDKKVVLVRNALKAAWRMFKERVLGLRATYRKTSPTTVTAETVATLRAGPTEAKRVTITEESVPIDDLPDEVRLSLINNPAMPVTRDLTKDIEEVAVKRAEEENIPVLELGLGQRS